MVELAPIFKKAYWSLVVCGGIYALGLLALTNPWLQRNALYAHKLNPAKVQDLNDVESFGFLKQQVQPFYLKTPDNETLYGWHVLPLQLCQTEANLLSSNIPSGPVSVEELSSTPAYKLVTENPKAKVVVSFHGNAAHIGSSYRPATYAALVALSTPEEPIHLLTVDYRGFGLSTGSPTEDGLITDGVTLVKHITSPLTSGGLGISADRIVILGQSLGTAVATGVAEYHAFNETDQPGFAGVILAAPFSSLARLLSSYSIKGLAPPLLGPLRPYPKIKNWIISKIADKWETAERVARLLTASAPLSSDSTAQIGSERPREVELDLTILHARDDWEIPWREGRGIWTLAMRNTTDIHGTVTTNVGIGENGENELKIWEGKEGKTTFRWERVRYGGHNRIPTWSPLSMAVLRAFDKANGRKA